MANHTFAPLADEALDGIRPGGADRLLGLCYIAFTARVR